MRAILEWLLSFFKQEKKLTDIENKIKQDEEKLEEIENDELSDDDVNDYLNK